MRTLNPNAIKTVVDVVTGDVLPTNQKQFNNMAIHYGVSVETLRRSYVGHNGRRRILAEQLTPRQAHDKYGIDMRLAEQLRCTVKPKPERKQRVKAVKATDTPIVPISEQTVRDIVAEALTQHDKHSVMVGHMVQEGSKEYTEAFQVVEPAVA